ncbi:bi-functional transferase/deacetylase [Pilimelia anulata]|uniref:Bi-functional transferase/deacetylase n=1 Tax=Pilimelia anulata TaxID=53371 RepID=A0A8J3F995_9ACTN|nr:bifunctional polysaccharide deacetylase/glycosyltransferase family 2 protein [Pilimelia anulata]GGJ84832.1 bi-functional transferase/deacetylase [Pilimelia anulata]
MSRRAGRRPGAGSAAAVVLLLGLVSILLAQAYVSNSFSPDHASVAGVSDAVPAQIRAGGPLVDASGTPRAFPMPPRTLSLTFDDGPDPTWTPPIADVLRRHGVRATFFVVGSMVAEDPALLRRLRADGHEIGIHTFTHPDLGAMPRWGRRLQYSLTQLSIAGATGVTSGLFRPPYSSGNGAIDNTTWEVLRDGGAAGYLSVLSSIDSRDWARPGVDRIVANATPPGGGSGIVLMHDAGGDRSQTVAALDRYLTAMTAAGYRFVTVEEALAATTHARPGAAAFVSNPAADRTTRWRGQALIRAVQFADWTVRTLMILFLVIGVLTAVRLALMVVGALRHARQRRAPAWRWGPPVTAPVSVIVPAYNESAGIAQTVRSLAGGDHPGIEVVVVDDGSTDDTAAVVRGLGLPNVRLVTIPNGGKANALNVGVRHAAHDLIVMVDGDTVFESDAVRHLVQPFGDPRVGAVAGNVKVGNRANLLARWQHLEYVIGFNLDRRVYDLLGCMPTVPGAIGAYRRQALLDTGGLSEDTLAEDTDLTIALLRAGWRVVYEERARSWTEVPTTMRQLWAQRHRWCYGTIQALWKHRASIRERGASGRFGRLGLPLLAFFQVVLPLLAVLIDVLAVAGFLLYDRRETAIAWLAMLAVQVVTAAVALRLDREPMRALWALPLQQVAYRQLTYLVVIRSVTTAISGARLRWQTLRRAGSAAMSAGDGASIPGQRPAPAADPLAGPPHGGPPAGRAYEGPPAGPAYGAGPTYDRPVAGRAAARVGLPPGHRAVGGTARVGGHRAAAPGPGEHAPPARHR